jgi:hypothetical protein
MLVRMCGKSYAYALLLGMEISVATMEISMEAPQKTKNRTSRCSSYIPLLDIYQKECKSGYNRDIYTPMFIAALFTIALWNHPRCPSTDE